MGHRYPSSSLSAAPDRDRLCETGAVMLVPVFALIVWTPGSRGNGMTGTRTKNAAGTAFAADAGRAAARDDIQRLLPTQAARARRVGECPRPLSAKFAPRCCIVPLASLRAPVWIILLRYCYLSPFLWCSSPQRNNSDCGAIRKDMSHEFSVPFRPFER